MSQPMTRRYFHRLLAAGAPALAAAASSIEFGCGQHHQPAGSRSSTRPNVVLIMADDQGWGDTAYNGHPLLKTPHLDAMAGDGLRFDRFYAGAPVCSPTRGSCLTGRHPYRYGITFAMTGHLRGEEFTLAEALKTRGYATGHFGKWHLGTLDKSGKETGRWGGWAEPGGKDYSPPWENGFDVCFSTESKVPTYDPMVTPPKSAGGVGDRTPGEPYGTYYWTGPGQTAAENLQGDDSRVIMDRAIPFIESAVQRGQPFLAVIWFHAPHLPVVAGPEHRGLYADQPVSAQNYFGSISALDEQAGRLRAKLRELGVERNTMLWYASDNGPEGAADTPVNGSAGPFRGRKRSLYEGGVRVPGILVWPEMIRPGRATGVPCSTSDYFPTVLAAAGVPLPGQPQPIDGVSLMPLIAGAMPARPRPIGFETPGQVCLIDNRYKIHATTDEEGTAAPFELFDLIDDPAETHDLSGGRPAVVKAMTAMLSDWRESCRASRGGRDYGDAGKLSRLSSQSSCWADRRG